MKKQLHLLLFFFLVAQQLLSQNQIKIQIKDAQYKSPIGFASLQAVGQTSGAISDINGEIELILKPKACFELIPCMRWMISSYLNAFQNIIMHLLTNDLKKSFWTKSVA